VRRPRTSPEGLRTGEPLSVVFVYGTLRSDGRAAGMLSGSLFVGPASVAGLRLWDVGPFPAVTRGRAPEPVFGECYGVPADVLRRLDRYEGCPRLYRRETCSAVLGDGRAVPAFVYVFARSPRGLRAVPGGRWESPSPSPSPIFP
jgi:gamma-glutamylcyclotransferase (GGCT)/AIG2-like uncharacterized protein YtfP